MFLWLTIYVVGIVATAAIILKTEPNDVELSEGSSVIWFENCAVLKDSFLWPLTVAEWLWEWFREYVSTEFRYLLQGLQDTLTNAGLFALFMTYVIGLLLINIWDAFVGWLFPARAWLHADDCEVDPYG